MVNLFLFSAWYLLLYAVKDLLSVTDRIIGTFILGLAQIIITEMVLGVIFKKLFPVPLFSLNLFISLSLMLPVAARGKGRGVFREIREEALRIFGIIRGDRTLLCIFILCFILMWWLVLQGYLFPSYSWDGLYYHLPIVGQIMQSGAIQEHSTPSFIQQYMNIFSKNINLFFLWNIIFLKSDVIVDLGQLPFTIAGALSVYSMGVKLGIKEKHALYSSLLFAFTPVLVLQSTINYVDVAVSMLFLVSLNFLLNDQTRSGAVKDNHACVRECGRLPVFLSGLSAGILLGSKPTGPLFIAVLICALAIRSVLRAGKDSQEQGGKGVCMMSAFKTYAVYFMVPAFCMGGYWYMRNWVLHGNPVYYMDVTVFGIPLLKGLKSGWVEPAPPVIESLTYVTRLIYVWMERVQYYMYDSRLSGFGPLWCILFMPALPLSLVYGAAKKRWDFLFVCSVLIITFLIHPRNWTTRYVLFIVGAGALSFGFVMSLFTRQERVIKLIALLLALYSFLTANSPCITPAKIKEFILLPSSERTLSRLKPFNIDSKVRDEYGYWIWIENNVHSGDTLAYTFERFTLDTSRPFFTAPLWNRGFSNRVLYVKADSYGKWIDELKRVHATYVLVKKDSLEDRWIEKERKLFYSLRWMGGIQEKFSIVYADEHYKIAGFKGAEK